MKHFVLRLSLTLLAFLPVFAIAQPVASFTATPTSGCSPLVVQFNNTSTGATSYSWTLGNSVTSTQTNPSTTYVTAGTYTVTLTASNGSQTSTATTTITVHPKPFVNFVASDSGYSCPTKTVTFTNLSVPGGSGTPTYYWDFGNGSTSTAQNPTAYYSTSGNFNVSLIVTNSFGCSTTFVKNNYIHTYNVPNADFTSSNNNSCTLPTTVTFTNTSSGGSTYYWQFGNGNTSTSQNPTCTYSTAGSYTVTLIVTNSNGCKDTIIKPNHVNVGNVDAQFTSASSVCVNNSIAFTNTSTPGPGNSTWYFGDGGTSTQASPSHTYTTAGTYTVKLVVTSNGCSDSITHNVVVNPGPSASFTATPLTGCVPLNVQFTNTSTGANSYYWWFGNNTNSTATNPVATYTTPNVTYSVKLAAISNSGCSDTETITQYITTISPIVSISANPNAGCAPFTTVFTAQGINLTLQTYSWNFGDGSPVSTLASPGHTYSTPGVYTVTLTYTGSGGCSGTMSMVVQVGTSPNANFSWNPSVVCPNVPVTFTNLSTGPVGTTYMWNFGDGTTSSVANPTHAYTLAIGQMTVTLVATSNGCSDTQVYVNAINVLAPYANFNFNVNCSNKFFVTFTDQSQGASTYLWNFGDGSPTTNVASPTHLYAAPGDYIVKLIVTNSTTGCLDSVSTIVKIYQDIANFTISDTTICEFESVTLQPIVNQFAIYNTYLWNFGDGTTPITLFLPVQTQPHVYTTANNYNASLIVTDIYNCKDTLYKAIHVGGPVVNFTGTPTSGCAPLNVQFNDFSSTTGSTITSRFWTFGDGGTLTGNNASPTHMYVNSGTYSVTIKVTDAVGCSDSLTLPNYISANKPTAAFTASDTITCPGQPVTFTNSSTGTNPLTYAWNFGDGGTSTQTNPSHAYMTNGNFTVRLIVTDANGCKDTLIKTNYIHSSSIGISFTMSNDFATCPPLAVNFTNTSTGNISSYSWTFGNGGTSNLSNPSSLYTYPGVYVVTLTGQSTSGCLLTATDTVTVLGPTANLSYSGFQGCAPLTVQFNANAQGATSITWDFNDGYTQVTTGSTVTHTYTQPGTYVPLVILTNGTCNVTFQGQDTVIAGNLDASFTYTPSTACANTAIQFTDTVTGNTTGLTHSWNFGDGGTSTAHNPSHTYAAGGTYQVKLIMGNSTNCYDTVIQSIVVNPSPNVSAGPDMAICAGQNTSVQLQATGAQSYVWTPATGLSCTTCANPVASPTSNTAYVVTGTSNLGCTKKDTVLVNVNTPPTVMASPNTSICQGQSAQLNASGASTYLWTPATGLSCTTCSNPVASPTATTWYWVIGTNQAGCKDTAYVTVTVKTSPTVTVTPNQTACQGVGVPLQATGAQQYSWTPASGLTCNNCATPTATPNNTTTYVVTGVASNGCTDTAQVTVTLSVPPVTAGPDAAVCDGQSAQLQAGGAVSYVWSPATGLSCTNCPNPTVNISTSATYTVTGTDTIGCTNTDQVFVDIGSIPVVSGGGDQTICEGNPAQLQASGAATYVWSPATGLSCTSCGNPSASPTSTTTYVVTGTTTQGCSDTASVMITVNPAPVVDAGPDQTLCETYPAQLLATGAVSYVWSPATGLTCTTCDNPIATPGTTTTYTATGTGSNGCTATDDVVVNIVPGPAVDAGENITICFGNSLQLHATGADTYIWSPATDLSCSACPDPFANPAASTVYTVVGTGTNGCMKSDSVSVTVLQRLPTSVSDDDSICIGNSTQLMAHGGDSYLWVPATGLNDDHSATPVASPTVTTTYMAVINQQGCFADTAFVTVVVSNPPSVSLGPDQNIIAGSSIQLNAEGSEIYSYAWDNVESLSCADCKDPLATPTVPTIYTVTVSNEFGCTTTDDISITLKCDGSQAFIPNTFTPNGDGNNDKFFVSGKGIRIITKFAVYDRWGEEVFSTQNIPVNNSKFGWDGTYKGKPLDPNVFVYMIEAICDLGDVLKYKGDISLMR